MVEEDKDDDALPPPGPPGQPIPALKSSQILMARSLCGMGLFWLFHYPLAGVSKWALAHLGIDLQTINVDAVFGGISAAYAVAAGAFWEYKRRQAGKKGAMKPRPIEPSPTVAAVKRLTTETPIPPKD